MPFLVVSFDFGGTSNVTLHACTTNKEAAEAVYDKLAASFLSYNKDNKEHGASRLVDLLYVSDDYVSDLGHTFYWGETSHTAPKTTHIEGVEYNMLHRYKDARAQVLKSNNV
jgi:hypothetical protein